MDDSVSVEKLDNGMWIWICQPGNGAYFQGPHQYKRKADAVKSGREFLAEERIE